MNRDYPLDKVRNFGVIAHIDAGKTTTSERILYYTGMIHKIGEVHEGETTTDWMEQERERGITITAAAITCFWNPTYVPKGDNSRKHRFNVIDTPGHIDFTVEVKRSLRVLDGAVVVFDGVAGVEPQSETNWRYADESNVPRVCFINKLDRMGASFEKSFASIRERLNKAAVRIQIPVGAEENFSGVIDLVRMKYYTFEGEKGDNIIEHEIPADMKAEAEKYRAELVERVAETDDSLMNAYLEGKQFDIETLKAGLRKATLACKVFPVLTGTALKNKGVQLVLDAVVDYLPSPLDIPPVKGHHPDTGEEIIRHADDKEPFTALAFKLQNDPFVGALTFFRVYSGTVEAGSYIYNATTGKKERLSRIVRLQADKREEVAKVYAGEIAAAVGLKDALTSHTLCDENNPIILEAIKFMEPVISLRIEPATKADQEKMGTALRKLANEDPTFRITSNPETGETLIAGMGELHLEIMVDRMKREFGVNANVGKPQVAYRETILGTAEAEHKYIKQSGGKGQYGHVVVKIEPNEKGKGVEVINEVVGGAIPKEFIKPATDGIYEGANNGTVAGYPVVDVIVRIVDGSFHEVDSSELAFKMAGIFGFKEAMKKANPILLEPIMGVEVTTPEEYQGDLMGDINRRRGQIQGMENKAGACIINAHVPLETLFGYVADIRSLSKGRASASITPSHFEQVPNALLAKIVETSSKAPART